MNFRRAVLGPSTSRSSSGTSINIPAAMENQHAKVSIDAVRRHAVAAQKFASRDRNARPSDLLSCVRDLSCVQLDSIATVERSHLIVLSSRVGKVAPGAVSKLLAVGALFEYWAHEACLLEIGDYPLWRRRMRERREHHWWGPVIDSNKPLAKKILDQIRDQGPLASRHFEGSGGGGMWNLKPAKKMLDALWTSGDLVVCGRQGFQRIYDLPERVLPELALNAPIPSERDALRALVLKAIRARGVLTASGVVNHYKLKGGVKRVADALEFLIKSNGIKKLEVEDGDAPVYVLFEAELDAGENAANAVLLSPFENLLWDRDFTRRIFRFNHLIEVYKKDHQRQFGYYVLPFLMNDKLVGRADLKSDREAGILRVKKLHLEKGIRKSGALDASFQRALARLARNLDLASNK
jgi:uncharacterized protein YcaQ